jgi:hypothetical protein
MSCVVSNISGNGVIVANPTETLIVNTVDAAASTGSPISGREVYKMIQSHGYVLSGGKLNMPLLMDENNRQGRDITPIQSLARLNVHFAINYGATRPVFKLQGFKTKGSPDSVQPGRTAVVLPTHDYYVSIDETQLNSLTRLAAPIQLSDYDRNQMYQYVANYKRGAADAARYQQVFNPYTPVAPAMAVMAESEVVSTAAENQLSKFDLEADSRDIEVTGEEVQYQDVADQIIKIKNSFRTQGIEVNVEVDPELPVKGRIIIEPGKPVTIKLNPTKITEDTHIHEFSHLLVELLGEDNATVKAAIKELKGTELYRQVKEKYPELDEATLDKEVVVTAVGLAGAKINRKNPNKFQQILNRIFRALAKALNINNNDSAVEELAKTLLEGRFDKAMFKGSLKSMMADSRGDTKIKEDFENILADVKIAVKENITKLERTGEEANEKAIARLKLMYEDLEKVKKIEQLMDFVAYASRIANTADDMLTEIDEKYNPNLSTSERLQLINQLHKVGDTVSNFYGGMDPKKSLMAKIQNLARYKKIKLQKRLTPEQQAADPEFLKLTKLEQSLYTAINKMSAIAEDYNEIGIPMMADLLLEYNNTDVEDQINSVIKNITDNRRLIAPDKNDEWRALEKKFKDGTLTDKNGNKVTTKEGLLDAQIALNIKQLENKKIGRETLINELREAQKDKSAFSYLLDPIVYSSQASLQMFALTLKNKMYEANDDTQEVAYRVADAYRKFAESKGSGVNPVTFNEDILEVHEYMVRDPETGESKKERMLTFVQPLDVTAYRKAESAMYEGLNTKYGIPTTPDERKLWFDDAKNKVKIAQFYEEVSNWYANNSEPSPDSQRLLQRLTNELAAANKGLSAATANNDGDRMAYYHSQIQEIQSLMNKIYDPKRRQFKGRAVQPLASKYTNPKYTALKANGPAFEYYTALLDQYKESQRLVGKNGPIRNSWENFSYVAPAILADGLEKVQKDGVIDSVKLGARETLNFLSTDTHYGDSINANKEARDKVIPIFYVNPINEKLATRDMASAIVQFAGMANMYQRKSEIQGAVMLMRDIVEKREPLAVNASNSPVVNRWSKIVGKTRYQTSKEVSNNFKHLAEFIDTVFFGEEELKASLNFAGREFSYNKMAGKLASFTALNNLAFNALQAGNQLLLDNVRLIEEGVAGQYFSKGDLAWAKSTYHLQLQGIGQMSDYEKFVPKGKMGQAINFFDALGETLSTDTGNRTGPRAVKAVKNIPMALQGIMENETAVTRMLAMMKSYEGKLKDAQGNVITNADGKPANLWDVFILDEKTGRYGIDPKVANADQIRSRFRMKISGLTKKTNQVKNKFDDAVLQRRWWGKLVMLFRRYFVPSLRRYYGSGTGTLGAGLHQDLELGTVSEGIYHTAARLVKETWQKKGNFVGVYKNMEKFEQENIKRFGAQASFMLLCILAVAALSDDDDEESYAEQFLIYQALRMESELRQFSSPTEFVKMAESPTATIRPLQKAVNLFDLGTDELGALFTGDREGLDYARRSGRHEKGDNKFLAKLEELIPIVGGIEKSSNPQEASKWFNLGAGSGK